MCSKGRNKLWQIGSLIFSVTEVTVMKKLIIIFISVIIIFAVSSCNESVEKNLDSLKISDDMVRIVIHEDIYTDEYARKMAYATEKTVNKTVYLFTKESYDIFIDDMRTRVKTMLENSFNDRIKEIHTNEELSEIRLSISSIDYKEIENTVQRATDIVAKQAFKYQIYKNPTSAELKILYVDSTTDELLYEFSLTN